MKEIPQADAPAISGGISLDDDVFPPFPMPPDYPPGPIGPTGPFPEPLPSPIDPQPFIPVK
jgi:hypothetical protein